MRKTNLLIILKIFMLCNVVIGQGLSSVSKVEELLDQVSEYEKLEDFSAAFSLGEKALNLFHVEVKESDTLLAKIYNNLGSVSIGLGEYEAAKKYFQQCLDLRQKNFPKQSISVGEGYANLGLYYDYSDQVELAIMYYDTAIAIYKELLPESQVYLSRVYLNKGICYGINGEYEKAIQISILALEIDINIYGENHFEVAYDFNNLGVLYDYVQDYKKSKYYYLEAKKILEKNGAEDDISIAILNHNIGNLYWMEKDFAKAFEYLNKALDIQRKILPANDFGIIKNLRVIGEVHQANGNPRQALHHLKLAQNLAQSNPNISWETHNNILYHLSNTHLYLGHYEKANQLMQEAMAIVFSDTTKVAESNNGFRLKAWANLQVLQAEIFIAEYKKAPREDLLHQADQNYQAALTFWQKKRQQFHGDLSKETWLEKNYETFEKAIECKLLLAAANAEEKYVHQAYVLAEESRALLLLDALQKTKAAHYTGLPDSLLTQEKNLNQAISEIDQSIFAAEEEGEGLDSQLVSLNGELFALQSTYDTLLQILQQNHPDYYQLRHQKNTIQVTEIQNELLTDDQGVLQYFVGDSSLFIFLIQKENFQVKQVAMDFSLNQLVSQWRTSVEAYGAGNREARIGKNHVESSRQLYEHLLAPFAEDLPRELTIIADGALGYLPFEALLVRSPERVGAYRTYDYLLHHHTISYAFSTSWWKALLEKKNKLIAPNSLLAIAPAFDASPIASRTRSAGLAALQHNQEEAQYIAQLWGGLALTAADATKEHFIKQAGQYQILHLATHAKANDRSGDFSFLAFTENPEISGQEKLYARELYELSLPADLVVLSACETGVGEMQRGEGIISLARGFSYAGARSILTTLWRVSDDKAARLMKAFYEQLSQGVRKDLAIQQSKINYLGNCRDREAHPFYWAAFVGMGNMESLQGPSVWPKWTWGVLGFFILSFGIWYWKGSDQR